MLLWTVNHNQPSSHQHDYGHVSLQTTILSLSINRDNAPPTPVNSPISPSDDPNNQNLNLNLHADPPLEPNSSLNSNINMYATQENQNTNHCMRCRSMGLVHL